ncbi:phosphotransferase enzyme family protein [Histoplasma capsulatum var. duboisii H88]|uniref:Phosphotransferase enzyme family protein n=2 Tax=Ajellomyces capsulatus (strain H88) TaxID=544711 RepID=F0UJA6_AJEC8|nr:phosphotransferase enzyme family protein [Histoplasma capsulatum var. duboisii H88]
MQLQERYRKFNVHRLQAVTAQVLGSSKCISMTKIGEGNYNKVFRLQMDDGAVAIARIPHPNAGPSRYTSASEVATMELVFLQIPVPKVLAWSASSDNPVGSEYIIMEEAKGKQLTHLWEQMDLEEKKRIIDDIVTIEQKLLSFSFSFLGSLYFTCDSFPGCEAAEVLGDVPTTIKEDIKRRFVIGPTAIREFWEKERSLLTIDRGPWKSAKEYVEAIAHREMAYMSKVSPSCAQVSGYVKLSQAQLSPQEHTQLLQRYLASISSLLPNDPDLLRSVLWHPDLHDGNIFIHEGKISSIIDWQSVWTGPLMLQARTPQLINYNVDIMLKLPENFKELDNGEKRRIRDQVSKSIQLYIYEHGTGRRNPLLNKARRQPFGKTLAQLADFAGNSWDDDILPFRDCLISLERNWFELGTTNPCPFHFSEDEIRQHHEDGEGFNETQDFWDSVEGIVDRSGWTAPENFDTAVDYFSKLREEGLRTLTGEERQDFELQTRWVLQCRETN